MAEYIDREALLAHMKDVPTWWGDEGGIYGGAHSYPDGMFDPDDVIRSIEDAPAADVAPVVHAHWIFEDFDRDGDLFAVCSHCKSVVFVESKNVIKVNSGNFCMWCGAKMDEEV